MKSICGGVFISAFFLMAMTVTHGAAFFLLALWPAFILRPLFPRGEQSPIFPYLPNGAGTLLSVIIAAAVYSGLVYLALGRRGRERHDLR